MKDKTLSDKKYQKCTVCDWKGWANEISQCPGCGEMRSLISAKQVKKLSSNMSIEKINKAFDEKFTGPIGYFRYWVRNPEQIKIFYTQQILSLIEELEGKKKKL